MKSDNGVSGIDHGPATLYRCKEPGCAMLFTYGALQRGRVCGHQFGYATKGNFREWIKIRLKMLPYQCGEYETIWEWLLWRLRRRH